MGVSLSSLESTKKIKEENERASNLYEPKWCLLPFRPPSPPSPTTRRIMSHTYSGSLSPITENSENPKD